MGKTRRHPNYELSNLNHRGEKDVRKNSKKFSLKCIKDYDID